MKGGCIIHGELAMVILNPFQLQWITAGEGITLATETNPAAQSLLRCPLLCSVYSKDTDIQKYAKI